MSRAARPSRPVWRWLLADPKHGTLPSVLLVLTVVTGIVDAVSILGLGRLFVANMTGNIVFIGFALAGAPGFSVEGSLAALVGFLAGAFLAGLAFRRAGWTRSRLLLAGLCGESAFAIVAAAALFLAGPTPGNIAIDLVAATVALAMGVQNVMVRRLAVPDMTTTVLTLTLTGLVADPPGSDRSATARRALSVAAMLSGAVVGAALVLADQPPAALTLAGGLLVALTVVAARAPDRIDRPTA